MYLDLLPLRIPRQHFVPIAVGQPVTIDTFVGARDHVFGIRLLSARRGILRLHQSMRSKMMTGICLVVFCRYSANPGINSAW